MPQVDQAIQAYNAAQTQENALICQKLCEVISAGLTEVTSKLWHGHPVWFSSGNPIVGYSVQKKGVRLMFWSGRSFDEPELMGTSRFMDASVFYTSTKDIDAEKIARWLGKSQTIQWDYKNIVKRKGVLERL